MTCLVILSEVVSASLAATDLDLTSHPAPGVDQGDFSCDSMRTADQQEADHRKMLATVILVLFFLRYHIFSDNILNP